MQAKVNSERDKSTASTLRFYLFEFKKKGEIRSNRVSRIMKGILIYFDKLFDAEDDDPVLLDGFVLLCSTTSKA